MAAKLILSVDGVVINEHPINKERMTIGRKAHNDIILDNLAVSGEHAAIVTILNDSFLEDLDSTNGLEVNGVVVKKHFMQPNDVISIGKYQIKYINDQANQTNPADFEKTMVLRAPVKQVATTATEAVEKTGKFGIPSTAETAQVAVPANAATAPTTPSAPASSAASAQATASALQTATVQILTGPNAGKELELVKNLTTLGKPGVQVAVLTRRPHGYFITHVEGAVFPSVNGQVLTDKPHQMNDHDVIELAGVKMEFYFKG
ncbi:MAG: hypothetical protein A2Z94_00080 [Gallionellales bacterium GWA2_55_18]|nr:MAG: hypothetical protein A2Z94_00080 [Gallionellales bacterium GWA2_55_18]